MCRQKKSMFAYQACSIENLTRAVQWMLGSGCFSFRSAADAITQYVVGYDNHYRPRHHNDDRAALFSAQSFGSAKQVAAYLGLISRLNESGAFKNQGEAVFGISLCKYA